MLTEKMKWKATLALGLVVAMGAALMSCGGEDGPDAPLIPVILSFTPASGEAGDQVTIVGTDLDNATEVTFNGTAATIVSNSATEIVAEVPEGSSTGKVAVRTAGGLAVSTGDFTVIVIGAVTVAAIEPRSAQRGENVVITGTDMTTVSSVKVGNVEATIAGTTDTSVEITIPEGAAIGASTVTIVNTGGTFTSSTENLAFYVIKTHPDLMMTFDGDHLGKFTGSPDPEESTVFGTSDNTTVIETAQALPDPVDGHFFHFEGYSSTSISGNYTAIVQSSGAMPVGTFAEFFAGATEQTIYFNLQMHLGDLPEGYDGALVGLRFRFNGGDYEYIPTVTSFAEMELEPNEDGWYSLSFPAEIFTNGAALGTHAFTDMQRVGVAPRRNYGTGGTAGVQVTEADGGVFYATSFDNLVITVGGPYSY